jgi:hypothetical protein
MRQHYVAVVRKEADSDFRAFFPDFSCVVASAPTLAEAIKKAAQALALNSSAIRLCRYWRSSSVSSVASSLPTRSGSIVTVNVPIKPNGYVYHGMMDLLFGCRAQGNRAQGRAPLRLLNSLNVKFEK